ncbi:MAG: S8 family serine peptidase [Candidatus Hermodarchaeota archaeon]
MKNLRSKTNFVLIGILTFTSIFSPILGSSNLVSINHSEYNDNRLKFDELPFITTTKGNKETPDISTQSNKRDRLFDDRLISSYESIPDSKYVEMKIIMLFEEETSKSERILAIDAVLNEYEMIDNYDIIPGVYLKCDPNELFAKKAILEEISILKKVFKSNSYESPYYLGQLPESSALSSNNYPNWWLPAIGAENLAYDGTGVSVAVLDTGIYEHPDLNIVANQNFVSDELPSEIYDYYGHGTHVAGIIGGSGISSSGKYRGVAPGVSLINAKSGSLSGLEEGDIISAIDWSVNTVGADILSMSFGDTNPIASDPLIQALAAATDLGVICVSSAGNSGPGYFSGGSPSSGIDVISVGATDSNNNLASFSSWGPSFSYLSYPDVVAPGVDIIATEAPESAISDELRFVGDYFDYSGDGDYIPLSGTSMSCPMVAGALAILKDAYPSLTPESARIALLEGAQVLPSIDDSKYLKSGYGLINVTASLMYLNYVNETYSDVNDIAKITPNILPVEPYDLIHFPGDHQKYNLTVISGESTILDINIPSNVDGLTLSTDKTQIVYTGNVAFDVKINSDATPGIRTFEVNITSGVRLYDKITITIEVRLPEYKIIMDSYHGMNDWHSEYSFYQMGFSNWMRDVMDLNISIDYLAEYWTPNFDRTTSNSILTEELLAQYDLLVLQSPFLPFNHLEFRNLKQYFNSGGNILFLGTRYQDLCLDNLNDLFSYLNLGIEVNEENIADESWLGLGATVDPQAITDLTHTIIFQDVNQFAWNYGSSLSVTGPAEIIAANNGNPIAGAFDNRGSGGGRFVAFGDLHWATELYESSMYRQDHHNLTSNLMNYFFNPNNISIDINLPSERTPTSQLNLSIFIKDLNGRKPIDAAYLNAYLNVSVENDSYNTVVNMISTSNGISINNTYTLPITSDKPYLIKVNITFGGTTYYKTSKILYYNSSQIPEFASTFFTTGIERHGLDTLYMSAILDRTSYEVESYMSILPYSYYNKRGTTNKTFVLANSLPNLFDYRYSYQPTPVDPSGYATFYVLPYNPVNNYYNPYAPRMVSTIVNNPPEFIEDSSNFILIDISQMVYFEDTHEDESVSVYPISQGNQIDFEINLTDSVSYEDQDSSGMRVSVNLFLVSITENSYIVPLNPKTYILSELSYRASSNTHNGRFTFPFTMNFQSITGTKKLSTESQYDTDTQDGYLAIIWITAFDSEGESEDFIIAFLIQAGMQIDLLLILVIVGIVVVVGIIITVSLLLRRKKKSRVKTPLEGYYETHYGDETIQESDDYTQKQYHYCPYCGYQSTSLRNFCPSCGKSLKFQQE